MLLLQDLLCQKGMNFVEVLHVRNSACPYHRARSLLPVPLPGKPGSVLSPVVLQTKERLGWNDENLNSRVECLGKIHTHVSVHTEDKDADLMEHTSSSRRTDTEHVVEIKCNERKQGIMRTRERALTSSPASLP